MRLALIIFLAWAVFYAIVVSFILTATAGEAGGLWDQIAATLP